MNIANCLLFKKGIENRHLRLVILLHFGSQVGDRMYKLAVCFIALLSVSGFTFETDGDKDLHSASNLLKKIEEGRDRLKKESVQMIMGTVGTRRVKVGRRSYKEVP